SSRTPTTKGSRCKTSASRRRPSKASSSTSLEGSSVSSATAIAVKPRRATSRSAFGALLLRDLAVLRKEIWMFLGRTVIQPLLLIFVFAYVFPKIGQAIGGAPGAARFSTLLVGGVIASSMIFQGVQAVALPLVQDFGY